MKRGQKASQRRLETKGERGLQMRVKKAESTAQKMVEEEDGKGLQKLERKRKKRAVQKGKNGDKWTVNKRKERMQITGLKG